MDVQKALSFPKGSKERKDAWQHIIRRGDYEHNISVMKGETEGSIAVIRVTSNFEASSSKIQPSSNNEEPKQCGHGIGSSLLEDV